MLKELQNKYADNGDERIGFILDDGTLVEMLNSHDDPEFGAKFRSADLFAYLYDPEREVTVTATWHTHPSASCNLSGEDYIAFQSHPDLTHYIVGNDGVGKFTVDETGTVKRD